MIRSYAQLPEGGCDDLLLSRSETHHLVHVLRRRPGDELEVFDGKGSVARAVVVDVHPSGLRVKVSDREHRPKPLPEITLYQALAKGVKMETIVQKAVELGANRVVPLVTERSVVRLDAAHRAGKTDRWQTVAVNAAKQCGTAWLTRVDPVLTFRDALTRLEQDRPALVASLEPRAVPLRQALAAPGASTWTRLDFFIGPEGDFSPEEYEAFRSAGAVEVSLGDRILRTETAALFALSVLSYVLLR